jgi:hypothetical protein
VNSICKFPDQDLVRHYRSLRWSEERIKERQHLHLDLNSGGQGGTRTRKNTVSLLIKYFYKNRLVQAHIYLRSLNSYKTCLWLICKLLMNYPLGFRDNSSNDNSISLCNINIRSIRNKTNFVQHFADEFDILVITESHLDNNIQNDDIELCSFTKNIQRRDRQNQTGGGLLIYAKENVIISRLIQLQNNLDESLWVQIHAKDQSFLLCNIYCPQWTDNVTFLKLN